MVFPLVAIFAFGTACLLTYVLASPGGRLLILDRPNERSLHTTPIPRTGGLAIWAGCLLALAIGLALLGMRVELGWVFGAALPVGVVSFIDDRFRVSAGARLAVHFLGAGLLFLGGFGLPAVSLPGLQLSLPAGVAFLLTVLFVVWMTNLYNFMDGMDGLAGGMGVFGFGTLGLLGYTAGDAHFAALSWGIAAAAGGFLVLNFPPARIFMGDTGASVLGFMAAALSLWGQHAGLFPLWVAILVFSPFIVDATVTLLRRAIRKERVWEAHRSHYYQRLVRSGWGHRKTVLAEYGIMGLCAVSAVVCLRLRASTQWMLLVFWALVYSGSIFVIEQLDARALYRRTLMEKKSEL